MGIQSVAVYSTADKDSLHVAMADEAICIGGPNPEDSYLNQNNIITAAHITDADAIHPGYGFCQKMLILLNYVSKQKIKFIGPSYKGNCHYG
jgi:Acetyl/propionyl-CoA carboxylase, alpha subunit